MLRPVELLVPYADGGSLAELHELAGDVSREDTPEGVRVRALVPARLAERFARFAVGWPHGRALAPLARGSTHARARSASRSLSGRRRCRRARRGAGARAASRGSLWAISSRSSSSSLASWATYQSTSPSSLAIASRRSSRDLAAVVADHLLRVLGDLAGLAGQAERRVGEPRLARILGGAPRQALVLG